MYTLAQFIVTTTYALGNNVSTLPISAGNFFLAGKLFVFPGCDGGLERSVAVVDMGWGRKRQQPAMGVAEAAADAAIGAAVIDPKCLRSNAAADFW